MPWSRSWTGFETGSLAVATGLLAGLGAGAGATTGAEAGGATADLTLLARAVGCGAGRLCAGAGGFTKTAATGGVAVGRAGATLAGVGERLAA